ncbi:MAG: hypothetical protein QXQ61_03585 [Candidatus Bathyarchaeia archaeon]
MKRKIFLIATISLLIATLVYGGIVLAISIGELEEPKLFIAYAIEYNENGAPAIPDKWWYPEELGIVKVITFDNGKKAEAYFNDSLKLHLYVAQEEIFLFKGRYYQLVPASFTVVYTIPAAIPITGIGLGFSWSILAVSFFVYRRRQRHEKYDV